MILKERDKREHPGADKFELAGAKAEEQMAFYLRRAYVKSPGVLVLNDLRLQDDTKDVAQIDHLVVHKYGMILIESKSVTSKVTINKLGEWTREWAGRQQGMPSPIEQAKRQIQFLRRNLGDHAEQLLDTMLGSLLQKRFGSCPMETIVAISDTGVVVRHGDVPEVVKADQVVACIDAIIEKHRKGGSILNLNPLNNDGLYSFKSEEMSRVADFLIQCHSPRHDLQPYVVRAKPIAIVNEEDPDAKYKPKPPPAPVAELSPSLCASGTGLCPKCSASAAITWGKYGYYWRCSACSTNTPIKHFCPTCKAKLLLHKKGETYTLECAPCATSQQYYVQTDAER